MDTHFADVLKTARTLAAVAASLRVSYQRAHNWQTRGFPKEVCPEVERIYGIRCESIHPSVQWLRDDAGRVTGYCVSTGLHANNN